MILPRAFVIDSSVVAGVFLPDEASPLAAAVRDQWTDLSMVAPRLLRLEFLNVALTARRRGRLDQKLFEAVLIEGAQFPVTYDDGEVSLLAFANVAYELGLTSYDYAYVDCARRRGLPLATLDRAMTRACAALGVPTVRTGLAVHEPRAGYVTESTLPKPRARSRAR